MSTLEILHTKSQLMRNSFMRTTFQCMKSIYFWLLLWAVLFSVYSYFLHSNIASATDKIAYYSQLFFDFAVGISCFLAYKTAREKSVKHFFMLTLISVFIGLYSDEAYNFIFHFIKISAHNPIIDLLWIVPYTLFLIIQLIAWAHLIIKNDKEKAPLKKIWFTTLSFTQAALLVFITVLLVNFFKATSITTYAITQIINTTLEIFLFFIVAITLARSKEKWLSCFSIGILLLIAFNMTHRFSYASGYFNKTFDVAWLVSFVFIIFGFVYFITDKKRTVGLHGQKSIFVLTSSLLLLVTSILFFAFALLEILMSNFIESSPLHYLENFIMNVPGILIFSFMIAVFIGKTISLYALNSIDNMTQQVDLIQHGKLCLTKVKNREYHISEIQQLNDFILQTVKKLHDANQAKSTFLMNMSHDLRTPISGILSMSKFVYEKIQDQKIKAMQKLVVGSSEQLMEIIDQILGYYQLLNQQKELFCEKIDIAKLLNDIVLFMAPKSAEKNLQVDTQYSQSILFCVCDRIMLHRLLLNIFSNAVKFTEKGYVKIFAHHNVDENNIVIKIEDSGIGIDQSHLETIFEPFFQIESPDTSQYDGIGLGLSHAKLLIEKLRGKINVYSTLGLGSTFEIILPISS